MHKVYIGAGSNLGDKLENIHQSMDVIERSGVGKIIARSAFYETEPVGYKAQDWFVNAVLKVKTDLTPLQLLGALKNIEYQAGRTNTSIRFGPRIIDLDILLFDQLVLNTPSLVVPHPRMHKRRFVLKPLCDIDPDVVHPVFNLTARNLLLQIDEKDQGIFRAEC